MQDAAPAAPSASVVAAAENDRDSNHLELALRALTVSVANSVSGSAPASGAASPLMTRSSLFAESRGSVFATPTSSPVGRHSDSGSGAASIASSGAASPVACSICLSPIAKRRSMPWSRGGTPSSSHAKDRGGRFRTECCGQLFHKECMRRHKEHAVAHLGDQAPQDAVRACPLCRSVAPTGLTPSNRPQARVPGGPSGGFVSAMALHSEMVRRATAARQAVQRSLAASRRTISGELIPRTVPGRVPEVVQTDGAAAAPRIVGGLVVPARPAAAVPPPSQPQPPSQLPSQLPSQPPPHQPPPVASPAQFASPAFASPTLTSPTFTSPGVAYQAVLGAAPVAGLDANPSSHPSAGFAVAEWATPPPVPPPPAAAQAMEDEPTQAPVSLS